MGRMWDIYNTISIWTSVAESRPALREKVGKVATFCDHRLQARNTTYPYPPWPESSANPQEAVRLR